MLSAHAAESSVLKKLAYLKSLHLRVLLKLIRKTKNKKLQI